MLKPMRIRAASCWARCATLVGAVLLSASVSAQATPSGGVFVDIGVSVIDLADPIVAGSGSGNLVNRVQVENNASIPATGVEAELSLMLPSGVALNSLLPSSGLISPSGSGAFIWTIGNLGAGATETLTVTMTAGPSAAVGSRATSSVTLVALNELDNSPSDKTDSEETIIGTAADLSLSKFGPATAIAGTQINHNLNVANSGP